MTDVRGVIFDFFGTLIRTVAHPETHAAVFARHGLVKEHGAWGDQWAVGPRDGEEHVRHSVSRRAYRGWELGRLRARARACGVPEAKVQALVRDLDRVGDRARWAPYEEVPEVIAELRRRGLVIVVCSNWDWDLDLALARVGLADAVDVAVSSAHAGARKPHPRVYQVTLARCGLQPAQAVFVGDSWVPDVEGPQAAGIRAVHLRRREQAVRGAVAPPGGDVPRIADLRELPPLL